MKEQIINDLKGLEGYSKYADYDELKALIESGDDDQLALIKDALSIVNNLIIYYRLPN
jgi:hypothetical protein